MMKKDRKDFEVVYKRKHRRPIYKAGVFSKIVDQSNSPEEINDSKVDDSQEKKS